MVLRKTYKQYVLNTVIKVCPFKKKSKYSYSYYYDMFMLVLKHVNSWLSLSVTSNYGNKSKYHYTTVRKMFNKWTNHNVFKISYYEMLKDYKLDKPIKGADLFIDACFISNKTGSELVGINSMYYKKNVTKLSIICDSNKIPLSITPFKSTTNDCKTIIDSLTDLKLKSKVNLIADKGYISTKINRNILFKQYKIKLIYPKKKNQKNMRMSKITKTKLRVRNKVENCIQMIKSFNRTMIRKDKKLNNFVSFLFIGIGSRISLKNTDD